MTVSDMHKREFPARGTVSSTLVDPFYFDQQHEKCDLVKCIGRACKVHECRGCCARVT